MVMMVEDVCICFVLVLGDIFTIPGLDCVSGDTFVSSAQMVDVSMENIFVPKPVVSMSITVKNQKQVDNFSKAINRSVITSRIELNTDLNTLKIKSVHAPGIELVKPRHMKDHFAVPIALFCYRNAFFSKFINP